MARYDTAFTPDYAVPPGETLAETLETLGMSPADLAQRSGLSVQQIETLLTGQSVLTRSIAACLEQTLGVPASLWLELERNYRRERARLAAEEHLVASAQRLRKSA
jgi:HTH-type transcriptional regulator / antitoxin HigA